jgi:epoxyqueuosine reductase
VDKKSKSLLTKQLAYELGFAYCGISKSGFLEEEAPRLENWLQSGKAGKMEYMSNHFDKRLDTRLLVPDSKSVISLLYNYYPTQKQVDDTFKISKYAYGQDYHYVIKDKLNELLDNLRIQFGNIEGRVFVDSAPVMDKAWAKKAGLGWIGKNSNLIHPKKGSFFFIAELILDIELEEDGPIKDFCGTCTRCIDACPTDAIVAPYVVDGSKCISYLTIELKDEVLPSDFAGKMNDWVFGCDVCQDVCPWNRFSTPHTEPLFQPHDDLLSLTKKEWANLSDEYFQELFKKSAVKRTKKSGLDRNIDFVQKHKK